MPQSVWIVSGEDHFPAASTVLSIASELVILCQLSFAAAEACRRSAVRMKSSESSISIILTARPREWALRYEAAAAPADRLAALKVSNAKAAGHARLE